MEKQQTQFEKQLNQETEARIARMEQPDYPFPRRFSRKDFLLWGIVTVACLALLIVGVRL